MLEKDLVNQFQALCGVTEGYRFLHKETFPNPRVAHMDIEFIYDNKYVRAEAKHVEDVRNQSQSALSIFGSILKGRNLPHVDPLESQGREVVYGLVLHISLLSVYRNVFKKISEQDWMEFGRRFDVDYIFVVSDKGLSVSSWDSIN